MNPTYRTIVADPPWLLRQGGAGPNKGAAAQYDLMTLGAITSLDVERVMEPDCVVFLWVPSLNLVQGDAHLVLCAWHLVPKSLHTWAKPGLGVGWFGRSNTEHFIVATRGKPTVRFASEPTVHHWPRRRHSSKPDGFFEFVERVADGPYLEMFARQRRYGWDAWGNEAPEMAMTQVEMGLPA